MAEMVSNLDARYQEVGHLKARLETVPPDDSGLDGEGRHRLGTAMHRVEVPFHEAGRLLERLGSGRYDGKRRLWARAKFIMREEMIRDGLEKTDKAMDILKEVANDVFSR
jgi:hypothetical protein